MQRTGVAIGKLYLEKPIIQGGMGIGISRSCLAGAVAAEGGMGVVSTAQKTAPYGHFGRNGSQDDTDAKEKDGESG